MEIPEISYQTGILEVSKKVQSSNSEDLERTFAFTVTLSDSTVGGTEGKAFGDMTFTKGVAKFTLRDGETATATGLPLGVTYTVTEEAVEAFTTESTGANGKITNEGARAVFTNTRKTGSLIIPGSSDLLET